MIIYVWKSPPGSGGFGSGTPIQIYTIRGHTAASRNGGSKRYASASTSHAVNQAWKRHRLCRFVSVMVFLSTTIPLPLAAAYPFMRTNADK